MKKLWIAKLFLAASLAFGIALNAMPVPMQAQATVESRIDSEAKAIRQADSLNLIPDGVKVTAKLANGNWDIRFKGEKTDISKNPYLQGYITLNAKDGSIVQYNASLQSDFVYPYGSDPFDESTFKFSIEEALDIAVTFMEQQGWKLKDSWMNDPYPISDYIAGREFHTDRLHIFRFDRSHDGVRDGSNGASVTVDRVTGDVRAYSVVWDDHSFQPNTVNEAAPTMISIEEAADLLYNAVDPFLKWQAIKDPDQPRLVYALRPNYVLAIDGTIPSEYEWENPSIPEKIKPSYSVELAKKRLLSMYDLNLEYLKGKLAYRLRLKPEINFFQEGLHPAIDAHTGEWLDFLNQPIEKPLPPAGEWLVEAAPAGKIDYDAAIVWDNHLLQLQNEPFIQDGYTLVPFRELLTKLGTKITWDPAAREVSASSGGTTIELTIDSKTAYVNGNAIKIEAPPRLKNGRTYIPARLVLETFGVSVGWNNTYRLVLVSAEENAPSPSKEELKRFAFQAQLNWESKVLK